MHIVSIYIYKYINHQIMIHMNTLETFSMDHNLMMYCLIFNLIWVDPLKFKPGIPAVLRLFPRLNTKGACTILIHPLHAEEMHQA